MDGFGNLILASTAFVVTHFALSSRPVRVPLVHMISSLGFMGVYSAIAITTFVWMVEAFGTAPDIAMWQQGTTFARHLALGLMPLAFILLVGGYTVKNPTAIFLDQLAQDDHDQGLTLPGIIKITRHPVMWAVTIWSVLHIIARGDVAGLIFFGALAILSIGGAWHIDEKKKHIWGDGWDRVMAETSNIPFLAIAQKRTQVSLSEVGLWRIALGFALYAAVAFLHGPVIGVSLAPQG